MTCPVQLSNIQLRSEAISVGHNPWVKDGLFRRAAALPTISRPLFLSQQLLRTECGGHAPGDVVAATAALMETTHEAGDIQRRRDLPKARDTY